MEGLVRGIYETSENFRRVFLLLFTRELIRNLETEEIVEYKEKLRRDKETSIKDKEIKELKKINKKEIAQQNKTNNRLKDKVREKLNLKKKNISKTFDKNYLNTENPILSKVPPQHPRIPIQKNLINLRRISPPQLPPHLQYLKPIPRDVEINTGKLNQLMKDPNVKIIECTGDGEQIKVSGTMGDKDTSIILNESEINNIIENFARAAKIPIEEGITRMVVGKFMFYSIVSKIIGNKFIIQKMNYNPGLMQV